MTPSPAAPFSPLTPLTPPRDLDELARMTSSIILQRDREREMRLSAFPFVSPTRDFTFGMDGLKEYARARGI